MAPASSEVPHRRHLPLPSPPPRTRPLTRKKGRSVNAPGAVASSRFCPTSRNLIVSSTGISSGSKQVITISNTSVFRAFGSRAGSFEDRAPPVADSPIRLTPEEAEPAVRSAADQDLL